MISRSNSTLHAKFQSSKRPTYIFVFDNLIVWAAQQNRRAVFQNKCVVSQLTPFFCKQAPAFNEFSNILFPKVLVFIWLIPYLITPSSALINLKMEIFLQNRVVFALSGLPSGITDFRC